MIGNNTGNRSEQPLELAERDASRMAEVLTSVGNVRPDRLIFVQGGTARRRAAGADHRERADPRRGLGRLDARRLLSGLLGAVDVDRDEKVTITEAYAYAYAYAYGNTLRDSSATFAGTEHSPTLACVHARWSASLARASARACGQLRPL